ncbi:DUF1311 domain-containing protein [Neorhizobium lilium]|uniref:DUF1311 domain-containing protein n=1 Tax=Neorhizobium lilium TaxID=2503024 RepID=A0A3S4UQQ6_9HYPH|nr:lysozyme inhibitor LprI family protein [Neorhizobium lilium]RWX78881.1 DUF1311 domain-containing protein [Neorhizobium lilium]
MLKSLLLPLLCGCVLLQDAPVDAQEPKVDCETTEIQVEMTFCSEQQYNVADKRLNSQYQAARKVMKAWDADAMEGSDSADAAFVKAQRAWVAYRDAQCESYGFQGHGGSIEPQLIYDCQRDLTEKRTAEIKELAEAMGN